MPLPPDDPRHGERRGYIAGCRESCCRIPHNEYLTTRRELHRERQVKLQKLSRIKRERAREAGAQQFTYPAGPVREHVQRLLALHWSSSALAAIHGDINAATINLLVRGQAERVESKTQRLTYLPYTLRVPAQVSDGMWVPTLGARRRLEALFAMGHTATTIRAEMGRMFGPQRFHLETTRTQISAGRWRRIDAVYQVLNAKVGPSIKNRSCAATRGWATAAAWDWNDIDNPDASPRLDDTAVRFDEAAVWRRMHGDMTVTMHREESEEVVRRLAAQGCSLAEVERRTGLQAWRYRYVLLNKEGAA